MAIYYTILADQASPSVNGRKVFTSLDNTRKIAHSLAESGKTTNVTIVGYNSRRVAEGATLSNYYALGPACVERFETVCGGSHT